MSRYLLLSLLIVGIVALCGCSSSDFSGSGSGAEVDTAATFATDAYWPLKLGNTWSYKQVEGELGLGGITYTTTTETVRVASVSTATGAKWFNLRTTSAGELKHEDQSRHATSGLLWRRDDTSPSRYLIKLPLAKGTTWDADIDGRDVTCSIISTRGTVTVPAGTFTNCVITEYTYLYAGAYTIRVRGWYAPNVGPVKEEAFSVDLAKPLHLRTLKSYTLR